MHLKWHPRILWEKKADEWFYYSLKKHPDTVVRKPEPLLLVKTMGINHRVHCSLVQKLQTTLQLMQTTYSLKQPQKMD